MIAVFSAIAGGTTGAYERCLQRGYAPEWCSMQFHGEDVPSVWNGCVWESIPSTAVLEFSDAYPPRYNDEVPSTLLPDAQRCILETADGTWHIERYGQVQRTWTPLDNPFDGPSHRPIWSRHTSLTLTDSLCVG